MVQSLKKYIILQCDRGGKYHDVRDVLLDERKKIRNEEVNKIEDLNMIIKNNIITMLNLNEFSFFKFFILLLI